MARTVSFGGGLTEAVEPRYMRQRAMADALTQQSQGPISGWGEGVANLARTAAAGFINNRADTAQKTAASARAEALRNAMASGDPNAALQMLGQSEDPDLQGMALNYQMARMLEPGAEKFNILTDEEERQLGLDPSGTYQRGSSSNKTDVLTSPQSAKGPVVQDFYEGSEVVQKQYDPTTGTWVEIGRGPRFAPDRGGEDKTSLVPFFAKGPDGKLRMYQPTASGVPKEVMLPEGFEPAPGVQYLDAGTAYVPVDKRGGPVADVPAIPKDVHGEAAAKEGGKLTGEAQVNLPGVRNNARAIKDVLNRIRSHPGRTAATGGSSVLNPVAIPGSDRRDFLANAKQLQGQAFLQAYESLKGGGQITEVEGAKAEAAKVALDNAQSEAQYLKALDDFEREVDALVTIAEQKAGSAPSPMAPAGAPPVAGPNIVPELTGPGWQ